MEFPTFHTLEEMQSYYREGQVLLIDKPYEWTSFDVVKKLKGALKRITGVKRFKVGHAGTLDPLATGLLIVCTGKATKTIESIQAQQKTYTGTITLGATTPSYDLETEVDATYPTDHLTAPQLHEVAASMTGTQQQIPPVFSAKKVDGKRAYLSARKGIDIEMKANTITIEQFNLTRIEMPEADFEIKCSKGTYIRSMAHDFGQKLQTGGHLTALRRTAIGNHQVHDAFDVVAYTDFLFETWRRLREPSA